MCAFPFFKGYCILSNNALRELAEKRPATPEEALEIKGIGLGKVTTVLPPFLKLIASHGKERNL
ncbi:MAG: HRDC domain-containing protein [Lentisphaeria bacterium]|nr:HRDC domain-containing protein [Lentisphaeria bacterium]